MEVNLRSYLLGAEHLPKSHFYFLTDALRRGDGPELLRALIDLAVEPVPRTQGRQAQAIDGALRWLTQHPAGARLLIDQCGDSGRSWVRSFLIGAAVEEGEPACLRECLRAMGPADLARRGAYLAGKAVKSGNAECLRELMGAGAPMDGVDEMGRTLLMRAVERGSLPMCELLAPVSAPGARCERGCDALMRAARAGQAEVVEFLLASGVGSLANTDSAGMSALSHAATRGDARCVSHLMQAWGKAACDAQDWDGLTPLMRAITHEHPAAARLLLPLSDLSLRGKKGENPGELARETGQDELAQRIEAQMERAVMRSELPAGSPAKGARSGL